MKHKAWFRNYDYSDGESTDISPGGGLYHGRMDRYKSIKDFLNKKRKRNKAVKQSFITKIEMAARKFEKFAQETTVDTSFTDSIRKSFGPLAFKEAEIMLNEKAVSSIPIRIAVANNKASFVVQSTGMDSAEVDAQLSHILNQKYSSQLSRAINKAFGGKSQNFDFGLITVE